MLANCVRTLHMSSCTFWILQFTLEKNPIRIHTLFLTTCFKKQLTLLSQPINHHLKLQGNGTIHPSDGRFRQIWVSCSCRLPNIPALIRGQLLDSPKQQQQHQQKYEKEIYNKKTRPIFLSCYFELEQAKESNTRPSNHRLDALTMHWTMGEWLYDRAKAWVSQGTLHRFLLGNLNFFRALHACVLWLISLNSLQLYCSNITTTIGNSSCQFQYHSRILKTIAIF